MAVTHAESPAAPAPVAPTGSPAPGRRGRSLPVRLLPYLLVVPTVLGTAYLLVYPLIRNLVISFQKFGIAQLIRGGADFVGLDNYRQILSDGMFWSVVARTFVFTAINVALIMGLATAVALLIGALGKGLRLAVMGGLVVAWAIPVIAATTVFQWLFQSQLGVVNWVLVALGFERFEGYAWFANGTSTFAIIVVLIVWQSVPFAALTLYAAMTTVPRELHESAQIDGAGGVRTFTLITFPILRPMFGLILCLEIIWVFKCFVQIWAISQGGPGNATLTLPVYAYQVAQSLNRYDLGAAISMVTVLILAVVLLAYFRQMFKEEGEL
ncbi:binding-protein-dependent transport systems inner membrane component [Kribbella flavida DSM 17836]|uniref:Binding-protein-dependent transport systems inner membrane component n=1 Tax=Kribbella flavida (strain DSM 17836 / JCM 10339 / NBRC 14399) TaxID=479435 RepID=D2PQL4_KRIFD|nr:binding-protein-dependent transport systems inner membrane component [Kribbella flavida DSM 17836]